MTKKPEPRPSDSSVTDREAAVGSRETLAGERERAADSRDITLAAREEVASLRDQVASLRDQALQARGEADRVRAEREHLLAQMRDANERLVIVSDRAETLARETEAARAIVALSEERFRTLVTTSAAIVFRADAAGRIQIEPEAWQTFTGTDATTALREGGWLDAVHPQDLGRVRDEWRRATATTRRFRCQHRLRRADGSYGHVVSRAEPIVQSGTVREWIGMITDVTDRVMLEEARERFIAILTHDLRNPLTAILAGANALKPLPEPHAQLVTGIATAARRMEAITRDVMDFARGRFGSGIPATPRPCDLGQIAKGVVAELAQAFPERTLGCDTGGELRGEWDGSRLEQVVSNLVGNAIEHGNDPITVRVQDEGDEVVLSVHNGGEPIPSAIAATLFEAFVRDTRPAMAGHKGSDGLGLGLYIVHEIVRAHGGTISLSSTRDNGTTFAIRLPRDPRARERLGPRPTGP